MFILPEVLDRRHYKTSALWVHLTDMFTPEQLPHPKSQIILSSSPDQFLSLYHAVHPEFTQGPACSCKSSIGGIDARGLSGIAFARHESQGRLSVLCRVTASEEQNARAGEHLMGQEEVQP
jgi:hypothetical protein